MRCPCCSSQQCFHVCVRMCSLLSLFFLSFSPAAVFLFFRCPLNLFIFSELLRPSSMRSFTWKSLQPCTYLQLHTTVQYLENIKTITCCLQEFMVCVVSWIASVRLSPPSHTHTHMCLWKRGGGRVPCRGARSQRLGARDVDMTLWVWLLLISQLSERQTHKLSHTQHDLSAGIFLPTLTSCAALTLLPLHRCRSLLVSFRSSPPFSEAGFLCTSYLYLWFPLWVAHIFPCLCQS